MMRTGMGSTASLGGLTAKGKSPSLDKAVVFPRSLTVMDGHDEIKLGCALAK